MPPQSLQKVLIVGAIVIATGLALWELQRILGGVSPTDKTGNPAVTASPSPPLQRLPRKNPPHQIPLRPFRTSRLSWMTRKKRLPKCPKLIRSRWKGLSRRSRNPHRGTLTLFLTKCLPTSPK